MSIIIPSPESLNAAVARALTPAHNVGGGRFAFDRSWAARPAGYAHNVGAMVPAGLPGVTPGGLGMAAPVGHPVPPGGSGVPVDYDGATPPPGVSAEVWHYARLLAAKLGCKPCNLLGGTPAFGYGGGCPAPTPPPIPRDANGCSVGWIQCKQPLGANALAVAAGAVVPIVVTPRRVVTPYQWIVSAASALTFAVRSIRIDGVEYLGQDAVVGDVPTTAWQPDAVDHSVAWADFSSTTPLTITVVNIGTAAADFRSTIMAYAARG